MADEAKTDESKAKPEGDATGAPKRMVRKTRAQIVKTLLGKVEKKMRAKDLKPTVGDYIRLVQLHQELDAEQPKEIKVTWVEPETKE